MKNFWKSVKIWRSYRHEFLVRFLRHGVPFDELIMKRERYCARTYWRRLQFSCASRRWQSSWIVKPTTTETDWHETNITSANVTLRYYAKYKTLLWCYTQLRHDKTVAICRLTFVVDLLYSLCSYFHPCWELKCLSQSLRHHNVNISF